MPDGLEQIGIHVPSLLIHFVNFLLLLAILYVLTYRPLLRILRERAAKLEQMERDMAEAALVRAEAVQERDAILRAAQREARRYLERATMKARKDAYELGQAYTEHVHEQMSRDQGQALRDLIDVSQDIVLLAAAKVLGHTLDAEGHVQLIRRSINEACDALLQRGQRPGPLVTVITAMPLTEGQWKQQVHAVTAKLGPHAVALHEVNPELLGGAALMAGGVIADASLQGRLHSLRRYLRSLPPPEKSSFPTESGPGENEVAAPW